MTNPLIARPTLLDLIEQPGAQRVPRLITVTQPTVGGDWAQQVPPGVVWHVKTITATFLTSAIVANRLPSITVTDGNVTYLRVGPPINFTAGITYRLSWLAGIGTTLVQNAVGITVPWLTDTLLIGGSTIASLTSFIDAGDQWSAVVLYVVERRPPLVGAQYGLDPDA